MVIIQLIQLGGRLFIIIGDGVLIINGLALIWTNLPIVVSISYFAHP